MAILASEQLSEIRRNVAKEFATQDWDKSNINSALQAVEDWFELNKTDLLSAIDMATSPFIFTGQQKKMIVAYWLLQKAFREKQ